MSDTPEEPSPEQNNDKQGKPKRSFKRALLSWLPYFAVPILAYIANIEIQTYLGEQAQKEVTLPRLNLEEAFAQATKEDKLVLANMSAIWCPSCRKLDQEVLSQSHVKTAIENDYVFSRIEYETDAGKAFMQRYDVSGFPTLLILDAQGNKLRQLPLTFSANQFIQSLR